MPEIIFNGPCGRIEGKYHHNPASGSPLVVVLHPDPVHGGTMNNKVTFTTFKSFVDMGFSVLRFNFRGVGRSEGEYGKGEGEAADATAALDWIQMVNPSSHELWVAGFSFGSWVAMQMLMRRPEIKNFVAVSPPANLYDFSFLAPCPVSGLIVQGLADEIVPTENVLQLIDKIHSQKKVQLKYKEIEGANHFFRGKLDLLSQTIKEYLRQELGEKLQAVNF